MIINRNRLTIFVLTLMLLLALCACGGADSGGQQSAHPTAADNTDSSVDESASDNLNDGNDEAGSTDGAEEPSVEPVEEPSVEPVEEPSVEPAEEPAVEPVEEPSVEPAEEPGEEPAVEPGGGEGTTAADRIVALAESLIGAEYEWGATGPYTFDNSGFVYYCFNENGIILPRKTGDMFASGTAVEPEDLLPGDLVFFTYNEDRSASYVGIYIGHGQFIAENSEASPVCIHDMTLDYYTEKYVGARRYL
jgi:cell wall-associated NlpC family hydrolase